MSQAMAQNSKLTVVLMEKRFANVTLLSQNLVIVKGSTTPQMLPGDMTLTETPLSSVITYINLTALILIIKLNSLSIS